MSILNNAFLGSLIADAVAMPVHWYYDVRNLDRDYPTLEFYTAPKNPHTGSILWRSSYTPKNKAADILHNQARYWGKRDIHYHQFLPAGENTVNYRLAVELYNLVLRLGRYDADTWLDTYITCMRTPGWHQDTYVEEYHRAFFDRLASGIAADKCGIDDLHIGGLASIPALVAALEQVGLSDEETVVSITRTHVNLTHQNRHASEAAEGLTRMLLALSKGSSLTEALTIHGSKWSRIEVFDTWSVFDNRNIIGRHLTPACYLPDSFTASLFLAWKYTSDFSSGLLENARCGGDNCHRGAVVGSLLGAINSIPEDYLNKLHSTKRIQDNEPVESIL
jgi:ADP-ribosyl-[dinitrogen reductase] hydrolase